MATTIMGNKINGLCRMHQITQCQLADRLGISHQSLKNKLNGVTEFKASELANLASIFSISLDALFYETDFAKIATEQG